MTDNWQLEDKVNEVIENHNKLLLAVHTLLENIEQSRRTGRQGPIDTISVRFHLNNLRMIDLLDLSPRNIEAHQPKLIVREPRKLDKGEQ
jgi:hypothetical protein